MNNYLVARWHQFLIARHFQTLFSPWHRQNPSELGSRTRTFTDKIMDGMADIYIRLIAAGIRMTIIIAGFVVELMTLIVFIVIFIAWLAWPFISIYLIIRGFSYIL